MDFRSEIRKAKLIEIVVLYVFMGSESISDLFYVNKLTSKKTLSKKKSEVKDGPYGRSHFL